MSCRIYINKLTDNEKAQQTLEDIHNSIFERINDSKLFRKWNGLNFLPSANASGRYSKAKALIDTINKEAGFPVVGTTFSKPTGREYAFVNVKNYLPQVLNPQTSMFAAGSLADKANDISLPKFREWAKRAGLTGEYVKRIEEDGRVIDALGVAYLAKNLYRVVQGEENVAEPEEIMHFAIQAIRETEPALFKQMLNSIGGYNIYDRVFKDYSKLYFNPEGKPDILRIKIEAITKQLVNTIIRKESDNFETPEKIEQTKGWWEKIKDWFMKLIGKAGFNPFEEAATRVLKGETFDNEFSRLHRGDEVLYAVGEKQSQEELYNSLKDVDSKMQKVTVKNDQGEEKEVYQINGKEVKDRVTDRVKRRFKASWENREITKSEYQSIVDDIKRQSGTGGHHDLEHIFHNLVNDDGTLRANPLTDEYKPETSKDIYNTLYSNLKERMNTYPQGTKFLSEVKIYDVKKDLAGTIDFLAITPEGKVGVLDWKFYDINTKLQKDVQWYNKRAWRAQMSEYRQMLEHAYNVTPSDFKKTEMVPIKANYTYKKGSDAKVYPVLTSIEVGNIDIKKEENDYLLPVALETQSTGDTKLDALLRKLTGLRERIEGREVKSFEERFNKTEQLNKLEQVIRYIQIKQSLEPLVSQADTFNKDVQSLINDYKNVKDEEDYSQYGERLAKASEDIKIYTDLNNEVRHLTKDNADLKKKVDDVVTRARELNTDLWDTMKEFGERVANASGVFNVMDPEVVVAWNKRLTKETSKLPTKTINTLYEERREVQNKMDIATADENEDLVKLSEEYEKLAKANGLNKKNYFKFIKKSNKNELIDQYKKEFYQEGRKATKDKNLSWIKDNIRVDEYKAKLAEELQKKIDIINARPFTDEEKNRRITALKSEYSTDAIDSFGWFIHYNMLRQFPVENKWESQEWTDLNRAENKAALDLYNWIRQINEKASDAGYIPEGKSARTFLPFVPQSLMEAVQMGDKPHLWDRIIRSITIDEDTVGYGAVDKVTGEIVNKIPRYFISETDKELSKDLIKNMAYYNEFLNRYKYLKDIEGKVLLLGKLERAKGSIITMHGKPKFNRIENRFETIDTNEKNADLFDKQVSSLIYGQKYVADGRLDAMLGNAGELAKRINKVLHAKVLPEDFTDKQLSFVKSVDTLNSFFQLKTLGLNFLPGASNYVGGHLQLGIIAGPYFGKREVLKAELQVMGGATTETGKKLVAAMKYFVPFTRDRNKDLLKKLSITTMHDDSIQDFLMTFMRYGDKWVEGMIFGALWNNAILIDGKIYNARQYVKNSTEYKNRYTSGNLKEQEAGFQKKVDDLIEQYSLAKQSKIVGNELVIPGVERDSDEVFGLRNKVRALSKRVIGNMSPDEVRGLNQSIITNSMMVFKNWIPPLADTRFTSLQYNRDIEAYEWGRARNMMRYLAVDGIRAFGKMASALKGTEKGIESLNEMYEYKKRKYYETTGQHLDMSKEDFYDMVRDNIRGSAKDALFVIGLLSAWMVLKAIPDDDEDPAVKNWHRYMVRALDKFSDEVSFYYSPLGWQQIIGGSIIPSIGVFKDFGNIFSHFLKEIYGMGFDEDLQEKNYVIKYLMKSFPVTSQLSTYLPLILPDFAKELGIQQSSQSRIF